MASGTQETILFVVFAQPSVELDSFFSPTLLDGPSLLVTAFLLSCQANLGIDDTFVSEIYSFQQCYVLFRTITAKC